MESNPPPFDAVAGKFGTILIDPPWRFANRTGKMAPEHRRLRRYATLGFDEIAALPVGGLALPRSHLYLWCPNALLPEGLRILAAWGFAYKTNLVWYKVRKDGGPDGRGVGFYFRNVTELLLFGVKGRLRTLPPGRRQVNVLATRKQEHSWKPDEQYGVIESCSPGPYLELFARRRRPGWVSWGDQTETYEGTRPALPGYNGHARDGGPPGGPPEVVRRGSRAGAHSSIPGDAMSQGPAVIRFYSVGAEYGCFSNFSPHPVTLGGKTWPTSEHYFQARKFAGTPHEEEVRRARKPGDAARLGPSRRLPLRPDWEAVKDAVMREAVLAKFTQHADLRAVLLGTGDAVLVEHTANDSYWGDGGDGSGRNRLGEILMGVRDELRAAAVG